MTQGKAHAEYAHLPRKRVPGECWVERDQPSLAMVVELQLYRPPSDLEQVVAGFIHIYNEAR